MKSRPRGASDPDVQYTAYMVELLCPQIQNTDLSRRKIPANSWNELIEKRKSSSLRCLAREYNVSHESIRRRLKVT